MKLDDFFKKSGKDEKNPMEKYPIIWKSEPCEVGECRGMRTTHRWSVPSGVPSGLMTECYDCHKTRLVKTDSEPDVWDIKTPSEWAKKSLGELNNEQELQTGSEI